MEQVSLYKESCDILRHSLGPNGHSHMGGWQAPEKKAPSDSYEIMTK